MDHFFQLHRPTPRHIVRVRASRFESWPEGMRWINPDDCTGGPRGHVVSGALRIEGSRVSGTIKTIEGDA